MAPPSMLQPVKARTLPWEPLGAKLDRPVHTAATACRQGGLNFTVALWEAWVHRPGSDHFIQAPGRQAVMKIDSNASDPDAGTFFEYASDDYAVVQYQEAFAFMDSLRPDYVAAGQFADGRQGFVVLTIPDRAMFTLSLAGQEDGYKLFLILRSSHDKSRGLEVVMMPYRERNRCALTLSTFNPNAPQKWSVRHIGTDPAGKLAEARETLAKADAYSIEFSDLAVRLAEIRVDIGEAEDLLRRVLPDRPRRVRQINAIISAWQESETNGFPDNGWGLLNAVAEFLMFGRAEGLRTPRSRFTDVLTGQTHMAIDKMAQVIARRQGQ
jgi:hypothetical protein